MSWFKKLCGAEPQYPASDPSYLKWSDLHYRVAKEDITSINDICPELVASIDRDGRTPLMEAVIRGQKETIKLLLSAPGGTKILSHQDKNSRTVFDWAIKRHRKDILSLLLQKATEPVQGHEVHIGKTAAVPEKTLRFAFGGRDPEIQWLLLHHWIYRCRDVAIIHDFLIHSLIEVDDRYVDFELGTAYEMKFLPTERSLASYAASAGNLELIKVLACRKANFLNNDVKDYLPLYVAAENGHESIVDFLLAEIPDYNLQDVIECAIEKNREDVAELLLRNADLAVIARTSQRGWSLLHWAVQSEYEPVVRMLLDKQVDVNDKNGDGSTPLLLAVEKKSIAVVRLLLVNGAEVNTSNNTRATPLLTAIRGKSLEIVELLIERNASLEEMDDSGATALMLAANTNQTCIIKLLIKARANINTRQKQGLGPLAAAIENKRQDIAESLIKAGANIDTGNEEGYTPLARAVDAHQQDIVGLLIRAGVDMDKGDRNGYTPLARAVDNRQQDTVWLLVKAGADANKGDNNGYTPLLRAALNGEPTIIGFLCDHGADLEKRVGKTERTPLLLAIDGDHVNAVHKLLQKEASPNAADSDGLTAFLYAVRRGEKWLPIAKTLCTKTCDTEVTSKNGRTALSWATEASHGIPVADFLIEKKAKVEAKDNQGRTPLSWAAGQPEGRRMAEFLLDRKADILTRDNQGRDPLSWAATNTGGGPVVELLIERGANIESMDDAGRSALSWAVEQVEEPTVARILLEKGACIDTMDQEGRCAISWAAENRHGGSALRLVLDHNAALCSPEEHRDRVNSPDGQGVTPLMWAVKKGSIDSMRELLKRGADANAVDGDGLTALLQAVAIPRSLDKIQLLLDNGAEIDVKNKDGQTALMAASRLSNNRIFRALVLNNADLEAKDSKFGRTALMNFCGLKNHRHASRSAGRLLLAGAALENTDNEGQTALFYAIESRNDELVMQLIRVGANEKAKRRDGKTASELMGPQLKDRLNESKITQSTNDSSI